MDRLAHEQAQVDEYIQQRKLDTVKSLVSSSRGSLLLRCAAQGKQMLVCMMCCAIFDPGPEHNSCIELDGEIY